MRWLKEGQKQENGDIMVVGEPSILHSAAGHYVGQLYLHFYKDMRPDEQGIPMPYDRLSEYFPNEESAAPLLESIRQACLRPRDRFWDIPVPKIDSAFDNLFVPQPSWSPSTTQQLRKLVAAPYLAPNDWTPRSEAYFVFPLAQGTPGKQCGLAATGVYQPSLRSPWLAAKENADNQDDYYPEGYTPSSPTITNTAKKPIPAIS